MIVDKATWQEIQRLRSALKFYANPDNWNDADETGPCSVHEDEGRIAREAISDPEQEVTTSDK